MKVTFILLLLAFTFSAHADPRRCTVSSDPSKNKGHCVTDESGENCLDGAGIVACSGVTQQ